MSSEANRIVQKLWSYCTVLRDDGLSYGDYLEQLSVLLFLKLAHEQTQPPWNQESPVPDGYDWSTLVGKDGVELETQYRRVLEDLGKQHGLLGLVFRKAQNKIQDPAKLKRLISDLLDKERWMILSADIKGDAYEGLLERNARDTKSGAGQYFTSRPLIDGIIECLAPQPGETMIDPACGTGGFLIAMFLYIVEHFREMTREQRDHLRHQALHGIDIVQSVIRLCAMNLLLHNVGPTAVQIDEVRRQLLAEGMPPGDVDKQLDDLLPVRTDDALRQLGTKRYNIVATNVPFGRKSSIKVIGEEGDVGSEAITYQRDDFWATTSNKQLNFVQHIKSLLTINGRAAVIVPDNVLFEGGAGEVIRLKLLHECDVHTLLRLPTGIFYAQGVKANVLFFDRRAGSAQASTKRLWVYDLRTNKHFTLKTNPLQRSDLDEFVSLYKPGAIDQRQPTWSEQTPAGRWRSYELEDLLARDKISLDLFWLKDDSLLDSDNLPEPDVIASEIAEDLRSVLEQMEAMLGDLELSSVEPEEVSDLVEAG
jgi:type I restriction enzyme M protein